MAPETIPMSIYLIFPILAALFWGFAQVIGKKSVQTLSINNFNSIREVMAVILAIVLILTIRKGNFAFLHPDNLPTILFASLVSLVGNVLNLIFLYKAMRKGNVNIVAVALCSSPIFVFTYSYFFFHERVTLNLIIGMILIGISIFILASIKKDNGAQRKDEVLMPILLAVISGACQSVVIVGNKILVAKMNYYDLNLIEGVVALSAFLLLSGKSILTIFDKEYRRGTFLALLSGITGRSLGCLFLLIGINYVDSIIVAPISNSSMFFAIFFGALILKEKIGPAHILSSALGFVGAVLVILR